MTADVSVGHDDRHLIVYVAPGAYYARVAAQRDGLRPRQWIYATRTSLRGLTNVEVRYLDRWEDNRDIEQILQDLKIIAATSS